MFRIFMSASFPFFIYKPTAHISYVFLTADTWNGLLYYHSNLLFLKVPFLRRTPGLFLQPQFTPLYSLYPRQMPYTNSNAPMMMLTVWFSILNTLSINSKPTPKYTRTIMIPNTTRADFGAMGLLSSVPLITLCF